MAISSQQLKMKNIFIFHWKVLGVGYIGRCILLSRDRTFWRHPALVVISLTFSPLGYMENFIPARRDFVYIEAGCFLSI